MAANVSKIAHRFAEIGRRFDARGWVLGTSGNFSVVLDRDPLRLAITASGAAKGDLTAAEILKIDGAGQVIGSAKGRPSAEALLHVEIANVRGAGAVLHTRISEEGYRRGELVGDVFPDVPAAFERWQAQSVPIGIFLQAACSRSSSSFATRQPAISRSS